MSSFDEWYVTKITTYVFSSKADENLARQAFKAGMERAAEIVEKKERVRFDNVGNPMIKEFTPWYAEAIRKEIEK